MQAQVAEPLDRLALLTGREPSVLDAELAGAAAPTSPSASVTVGDPAGFLRRRPDIRAAERRIQAANAAIGQHTADLFPKMTVFGNLGFAASDAGRILSGDSFTYAVAPFLQWNVLDLDRVRSQIDVAKGQTAEAVANHRTTVLSALQEAETALARCARQRERVAGLMQVQASADRVSRMTTIRVQGGTATLIDQLDAERRRVNARQGTSAAQAQLTSPTSLSRRASAWAGSRETRRAARRDFADPPTPSRQETREVGVKRFMERMSDLTTKTSLARLAEARISLR